MATGLWFDSKAVLWYRVWERLARWNHWLIEFRAAHYLGPIWPDGGSKFKYVCGWPLHKGSQNRNLTVIYLVQNVYNHGKSQRTISLNSRYNVVFRNGRDASDFRTMAYKICPNDRKWLVDSFTDATSKPYAYLDLDHNPSTHADQRVVTNILPGDQLTDYINSNAKVRRH